MCDLNYPAEAYLDPGTGSFVIQCLVGGALAVMFTIKQYWIAIKNFFTGKKSEQAAQTEAESSNEA